MASAALRLVADRGPQAVTMAALAQEIGAPTGSIYHRFASRELLLAELWMDVVEAFQSGFAAALAPADDVGGAVDAARFMVQWVRDHALEARLLLLHRRQDFVSGDWPAPLAERAAALEPQLGAALRAFGRRAFGRRASGRRTFNEAELMARLRYALLDAPFGGIKPYVQAGKPVPRVIDDLVEETVRATLSARP